MQQHLLKVRSGSRSAKKRIGRGDGFAGRGVKGQNKRVGHKNSAKSFEGGQVPLVRRMPKLGGFSNVNRVAYQAVNLASLEKIVGEVVDLAVLKTAGLIRKVSEPVKLLGFGKLTKKLTVKVHAASASAKKAIEAAGGKLELTPTGKKAKNAALGVVKKKDRQPKA